MKNKLEQEIELAKEKLREKIVKELELDKNIKFDDAVAELEQSIQVFKSTEQTLRSSIINALQLPEHQAYMSYEEVCNKFHTFLKTNPHTKRKQNIKDLINLIVSHKKDKAKNKALTSLVKELSTYRKLARKFLEPQLKQRQAYEQNNAWLHACNKLATIDTIVKFLEFKEIEDNDKAVDNLKLQLVEQLKIFKTQYEPYYEKVNTSETKYNQNAAQLQNEKQEIIRELHDLIKQAVEIVNSLENNLTAKNLVEFCANMFKEISGIQINVKSPSNNQPVKNAGESYKTIATSISHPIKSTISSVSAPRPIVMQPLVEQKKYQQSLKKVKSAICRFYQTTQFQSFQEQIANVVHSINADSSGNEKNKGFLAYHVEVLLNQLPMDKKIHPILRFFMPKCAVDELKDSLKDLQKLLPSPIAPSTNLSNPFLRVSI